MKQHEPTVAKRLDATMTRSLGLHTICCGLLVAQQPRRCGTGGTPGSYGTSKPIPTKRVPISSMFLGLAVVFVTEIQDQVRPERLLQLIKGPGGKNWVRNVAARQDPPIERNLDDTVFWYGISAGFLVQQSSFLAHDSKVL